MLADCLPTRVEQGAERLVDLATLTGAIVVALGSTYAGLMGNDDDVGERGRRGGRRAGRARLAAAAAPGVRRADQGPLRPTSSTRSRTARPRSITAAEFLHALRRRRAVGAPRHRRHGVGHRQAPTRPRAATGCAACGCSCELRLALAHAAAGRMDFDLSDDTRADPPHRPRLRRGRGRAGRRGARPRRSASRTRSSRKLGELGLMGIPFPEEYGGAGGDSLAYALAVEELTRVDSSVAITMCAHTSLGTQPIYLFGSEEQKQRLAARPAARAQARRVRADRARGGLATPATSARARRSTTATG